MTNIVIFDNKRVDDLYPFSVNHCSWEIRCGCLRLFEKVQYLFPKSNIIYKSKKKWLDSFLKRFNLVNNHIESFDYIFISGNIVLDKVLKNQIDKFIEKSSNFIITKNDDPIIAYTKEFNQNLSNYFNSNDLIDLNDIDFSGFDKFEIDNLIQINYLWDAIFANGAQINNDFELLKQYQSYFTSSHHGVFGIETSNIITGKNVKISPSVVLDASNGKIVLGNNVKIMPQSTIIGPCFIGDNTVLKIGAKIYGDNSIGEFCKIGGELENTIIHAYSNKQHEGFLGHSYIGEWVNFGADTNNSDLKNTYSEITMNLPYKEVKTGKIFLGLVCGDHTKTGINSMFTTGTVAGVCAMIVKDWFMPNQIKSFSFGGKHNSPVYKFEKAIDTAKIVMQRRGKDIIAEEIELLKIEYDRINFH